MNKSLKFIVTFFVLISCCVTAKAQLTGNAIQELRKSTVRVQSGSKVSTGFLWKNNNWVVTTLHSIDQSNNIRVTLVDQVRTAKVEKVLKRYDLALLKLDQPVTLPVLDNSNANVAVNSQLYVLGYNGR